MKKYSFFTSNELKPGGWLRRQLEIQADGLCGNLDRVWPDVSDSAWIGGSHEGWERVPYWLDGFIPLAYLLENDDMIKRAQKYVYAIVDAQQPDGWICPCSADERSDYDLWAVLLITKVLTVYYECSNDAKIPDVIYRVLKNFYELLSSGEVKLFNWGQFRWFEGFIAIDFMYGRCGEKWLLELAAILKAQGADYNEFTELWKTPATSWRYDMHIVNMAMMLKSEAVSCDLLGEEYTDNASRLYDVLYKYNGTPVGTFTGDECLAGLSPSHGTELCSVVELMYSYEHLYACTGEKKWAELLELAAFNALPATISDDMWTHQYDQLSNQIACVTFPGKSPFTTNSIEAHLFGLEPEYGCCTANFGQGWPKLALSAFMHSGDTVVNVVPIPSLLQTDGLSVALETEYPFENTFRYHVKAEKNFTLKVRVPSFAENLTVDGILSHDDELSFNIEAGTDTVIEISFDTAPVFVRRPHDLCCVKCGSLVFSLPIKYEKHMKEYTRGGVERKFPYCDYELVPTERWGFAYSPAPLELRRNGVSNVPFSGDVPPLSIKTEVYPINWETAEGYDTLCATAPKSSEPTADAFTAELIPYGCAKLRMTESPMISR